jgi:hypothetical protein
MQPSLPPRDFTAGPLPGSPFAPPRRIDRIAARRAFVAMKQTFMQVAAGFDDADGHVRWLQHQIRHAHTPQDLWELRGPVFAALRRDEQRGPALRRELRRVLALVFPDTYSTGALTFF